MITNSSSPVAKSSAEGRPFPSHEKKPLLPAREVDRRLKEALSALDKAQQNAVLLFAEVLRRKIYRVFSYSSIYQYAELELGFKKSKTAQFLRLCESFKELPELHRSVVSGELSWTKAREVARVATPETEGSWIRKAKRVPNRELERQVTEKKRQARVGVSGRQQVNLEIGQVKEDGSALCEEKSTAAGESGGGGSLKADPPVPVDVHVRMTPEQYARYQALLEALAKGSVKGDKAELLLAGLEQLVLGSQPTREEGENAGDSKPKKFTRVNTGSPYQVVVQVCPRCEGSSVPTSRGERTLSPKELRTILCDAYVRGSGKKNQAATPPRLRRAVLERDRFRCRSAGCGRTSFLAVHHLAPKETGGPHAMENLITLCSGCHKVLHDGP